MGAAAGYARTARPEQLASSAGWGAHVLRHEERLRRACCLFRGAAPQQGVEVFLSVFAALLPLDIVIGARGRCCRCWCQPPSTTEQDEEPTFNGKDLGDFGIVVAAAWRGGEGEAGEG